MKCCDQSFEVLVKYSGCSLMEHFKCAGHFLMEKKLMCDICNSEKIFHNAQTYMCKMV
jgi:hypothetical protein